MGHRGLAAGANDEGKMHGNDDDDDDESYWQDRDDHEGTPSPRPIEEWFHVVVDDGGFHLSVSPPGRAPWSADVAWDEIIRICFKSEGYTASDGIYVFVRGREASYAIPTDATGGTDLWNAFIDRKLFDAELAIKAAMADEGELLCWPEGD